MSHINIKQISNPIESKTKSYQFGSGVSTVDIAITVTGLDAADATFRIEDGPDELTTTPDANGDINMTADGTYNAQLTGKSSEWYKIIVDKGSNTAGKIELAIASPHEVPL